MERNITTGKLFSFVTSLITQSFDITLNKANRREEQLSNYMYNLAIYNNIAAQDVRVGPKLGQIGHKWDKSGTI